MDCIQESAARSLVRIEVLVLQGIARAVTLFAIGLLTMPIMPFVSLSSEWRLSKNLMPWWKRILYTPLWLALGCVVAVVSPFGVLYNGLKETKAIAKVEWKERWRYGTAKRPDGSPMNIPTPEEVRLLDVAITKGVIEDYNAEARMHGQGIPPVE